ncbi:MAG TPA: SRPBCC domain-containing protein [Vicinamibacteria bacterium]|nr:SRPBCC domain-containing protein [Vicinamibacteria bacterium]
MPEGKLKNHVLTIEIGVPRQRVWEEITKTGRIQRAMVNTVLESNLVPGSKLRYYSPNMKHVFVVGEVIEVSPPRKFSHTYLFTTRREEPSLVTWELEETSGGCRVTLTHGGWTDQVKTHREVVGGWREILDALKSELERGSIPLKTRLSYGAMSSLAFLLPKTRVSEVEKAGW